MYNITKFINKILLTFSIQLTIINHFRYDKYVVREELLTTRSKGCFAKTAMLSWKF